jgi:hypothetical protein
MRHALARLVAIPFAVAGLAGCNSFVGGAATGAAGAGAIYEYSNKEQLEDLEDDYDDGRIDRREYERRRDEIQDRSVIY